MKKLWSESTTSLPLWVVAVSLGTMNKAILRIQKLKSPVAVRRSMLHAFREQDTPNADPALTSNNTHIGAKNVAEAIQRFNAALPEGKIRKNAVWAVEYLITASPEAMGSKDRAAQDAYFGDALAWLREKHGVGNVVYAGIHRDETTPHMYAYVVPKDERGKLNCRAFFGEKDALSKMQTDFADRIGRKHSLERGVEGSKSHHRSIRQYYGRVNAAMPKTRDIDVPEGKWFESKKTYGERVAKAVINQWAPEVLTLRAKAQQTDLALQKARVAEQGKALAEMQLQQGEVRLRAEQKVARDKMEKAKELITIVIRGGEPLAKLQEEIKKKQEQEKDRGRDR